MDIVIILGYFTAVIIGISLGLIGGGGSILTVPAMVYILHVNPVLATAYSLFVVGFTSLAGSLSFMKKGLVNYNATLIFAIPSLIAVYFTRRFLLPAVPDKILSIGNFILTKEIFIMLFFAVIMLAASISMIYKSREKETNYNKINFNLPLIGLEGLLVGILTGIVGAGGGFLIIPALVLLANIPMKMAVGTSLLIIAIKSLVGFLGDIGHQVIDWPFITLFTGLSLAGIFFGSWLSTRIRGNHLKKAFGWFVLIMSLYIVMEELIF